MEEALEKKVNGNQFFKEGKFPEAIAEYSAGLGLVKRADSPKVFIDLTNNRAAAYLKIKEFDKCIGDCRTILELDGKNLKGFSRLIAGLSEVKNWFECLVAFSKFEKNAGDLSSNQRFLQIKGNMDNVKKMYTKSIVGESNAGSVFFMEIIEGITVLGFTTGMMGNACYVLLTGALDEVVLIDAPMGCLNVLKGVLVNAKVTILLTHGHIDHIMEIQKLQTSVNDLTVYVHKEDIEWLDLDSDLNNESLSSLFQMDLKANPQLKMLVATMFGVKIEKIGVDKQFKCKGDEFEELVFFKGKLKVSVMNTPGHSNGSCCFYCKLLDVCFTGDTLFAGTTGRTDLRGGNMKTLIESIAKKIYVLPDKTILFPGHQGAGRIQTTVEMEKKTNAVVKGNLFLYKDKT